MVDEDKWVICVATAFVASALTGLGVPSRVISDQNAWEECHTELCAYVLTASCLGH